MNKTRILPFIFCAFIFSVSCSPNLRKTIPPPEDLLKHGPLAKILVYSGNVAPGQSGANPSGMTLDIGGSAALSAQGRDSNNRPIKISPKWTASKPELIEITPSSGDIVLVKGLREGTAEIVVEYEGVRHTVEYIFVK